MQNKVQFDIHFYMMRRGSENIKTLMKDTFKLEYDLDVRMAYVKKVQDEGTKNHQEFNNEIITRFMPQTINPTKGYPHRLCPVCGFENYTAKLSKDSNMLWQQPLKSIKNRDVWYSNQHFGYNILDKFMCHISKKLNLSQIYTNHCIPVTGVTNLNRCQFTAKQIMSISGHKSLESLTIYHKFAKGEKVMMGCHSLILF